MTISLSYLFRFQAIENLSIMMSSDYHSSSSAYPVAQSTCHQFFQRRRRGAAQPRVSGEMLKSPVGFARQANLRCLESRRDAAAEPRVSGEMLKGPVGFARQPNLRCLESRRDAAAQPRVEEHATAGSGTLGYRRNVKSPARATQAVCIALTGLGSFQLLPRVPAASRPPPWAVLQRAFSAAVVDSGHYQYICYSPLDCPPVSKGRCSTAQG